MFHDKYFNVSTSANRSYRWVLSFQKLFTPPSLPAITETLRVKDEWIEYTLTIYPLSFGLSTLFWGIMLIAFRFIFLKRSAN